MCDSSTLTPWDAQTKRIHPEAGQAPTLSSSNSAGGQRVSYVAIDEGAGPHQQDEIVTDEEVAPTLAHTSNAHEGHHQPKVLMMGQTQEQIVTEDFSQPMTGSHGGPGMIAFEQNQREEVRMMAVSSAVKAQPGMKNQTYISTSSAGDSHAKTSRWPVPVLAFRENEAGSGLSSTGFCWNCGHDGRLLRMSPAFYLPPMEETSPSFSEGLPDGYRAFLKEAGAILASSPAGLSQSHGVCWTADTSESRNAAAACSLSQVLEGGEVPQRFYLSARAAGGILKRADRRGKVLPGALDNALRALAETSPTP